MSFNLFDPMGGSPKISFSSSSSSSTITTIGTSSYTVPSDNWTTLTFELYGAGGGGGYAQYDSDWGEYNSYFGDTGGDTKIASLGLLAEGGSRQIITYGRSTTSYAPFNEDTNGNAYGGDVNTSGGGAAGGIEETSIVGGYYTTWSGGNGGYVKKTYTQAQLTPGTVLSLVIGTGGIDAYWYNPNSVQQWLGANGSIKITKSFNTINYDFGTGPAFGIFAGGNINNTPSGSSGVTDKYDYASETLTTSTNITNRYNFCGIGNDSKAVFGGGHSGSAILTTTTKFYYANETIAAGPTISFPHYFGVGSSGLDYGIYAGGSNGTTNFVNVDKITYASETQAASTNLPATTSNITATNDPSFGYFFITTSTVRKFNWSTEAWSTSTGLTANRGDGSGNGTTAKAILGGGPSTASPSTATTIYTYATSATSSGTAMGYSTGAPGSNSSKEKGITAGGATGSGATRLTSVNRYMFASDVSSLTGSLSQARYGLRGTSTSPSACSL